MTPSECRAAVHRVMRGMWSSRHRPHLLPQSGAEAAGIHLSVRTKVQSFPWPMLVPLPVVMESYWLLVGWAQHPSSSPRASQEPQGQPDGGVPTASPADSRSASLRFALHTRLTSTSFWECCLLGQLTPLSNHPLQPGTASAACLLDKHDWTWTTPELLEGAFELTRGTTVGMAWRMPCQHFPSPLSPPSSLPITWFVGTRLHWHYKCHSQFPTFKLPL